MRLQDEQLYHFLIANGIANTPALNDAAIIAWGTNLNNVYEHYNSYLHMIRTPGSPGPIEKHPYIDTYQTDCDFQREFLLLGTFPPSTYFNNLPLSNLPNPNVNRNIPTHYFYGNTNGLWEYLFGLNREDLPISVIQEALKNHQISISDVFSFAQRKEMSSASDSTYRNIVLNCRIADIFNAESKIHTLLFTSGNLASFLGNTTSTLTGFRWILEDCLKGFSHFSISGSKDVDGPYFPIDANGIQSAVLQQEGGIIWWLQYGAKKIRMINLPSPAGSAARQMPQSPFFRKWVNYKLFANNVQPLLGANDNVTTFMNNYPGIFTNTPTRQYRTEVYQMVLNHSIHLI
jgi:hypothetical protein